MAVGKDKGETFKQCGTPSSKVGIALCNCQHRRKARRGTFCETARSKLACPELLPVNACWSKRHQSSLAFLGRSCACTVAIVDGRDGGASRDKLVVPTALACVCWRGERCLSSVALRAVKWNRPAVCVDGQRTRAGNVLWDWAKHAEQAWWGSSLACECSRQLHQADS